MEIVKYKNNREYIKDIIILKNNDLEQICEENKWDFQSANFLQMKIGLFSKDIFLILITMIIKIGI